MLSKAQNLHFAIYDNGSITNTPFLKAFPNLPSSLSTSTSLEIARDYTYRRMRAVFFGGNTFFGQEISNADNLYGKWSMVGAWNLYDPFMTGGTIISPGVNYLVNYHRWGNYAAHFGLRERVSDISNVINHPEGNGGGNNNVLGSEIKDAVLTWSYELDHAGFPNITPSRLIFQSIHGVDPNAQTNGMAAAHIATEHATILHNGNFGLGVQNPIALFEMQLRPFNNGVNPFHIRNSSNNSLFFVSNSGNVGIGTDNPNASLNIMSNNANLINVAKTNGNVVSKLDENGNFSLNSDLQTNTQTIIKGNGRDIVLNVFDNNNTSLFELNNNGDLSLRKLALNYNLSTPVDYVLKIDANGKLTPIQFDLNTGFTQNWTSFGNTFPSNIGIGPYFGTLSLHNIDLFAGNERFGIIHGANNGTNPNLPYKGEIGFSSSISMVQISLINLCLIQISILL